MQAWAQNLGHDSLPTTFGSYGKVAPHEQGELVRNAGKGKEAEDDKLDRLVAMVEGMQERLAPGLGDEAGASPRSRLRKSDLRDQ